MRGGTFLALADPMFQNLDYLGNFYTIRKIYSTLLGHFQYFQPPYSNNQYSHKKWALDCAAISQFFMSENNFSQAALCLESAEYVISNAPKEEVEADSASFVEAKSDIARCWVKLILNFMEFTAILQY